MYINIGGNLIDTADIKSARRAPYSTIVTVTRNNGTVFCVNCSSVTAADNIITSIALAKNQSNNVRPTNEIDAIDRQIAELQQEKTRLMNQQTSEKMLADAISDIVCGIADIASKRRKNKK